MENLETKNVEVKPTEFSGDLVEECDVKTGGSLKKVTLIVAGTLLTAGVLYLGYRGYKKHKAKKAAVAVETEENAE